MDQEGWDLVYIMENKGISELNHSKGHNSSWVDIRADIHDLRLREQEHEGVAAKVSIVAEVKEEQMPVLSGIVDQFDH